jgi:indole-3-glycerol phosphate synthase
MQHGASALSVLTDSHFFGGAHADLEKARYYNLCPILCKDFILDEYQITEARAYGADVILLIAAILDDDKIMRFIDLSHRLNMEVLVEVHTENELDRVIDFKWDHLGINARDLRDFSVSIDRAIKLGNMVNNLRSRIAESGIHGPADLIKLREAGFNGFLIGELFMKANDPGRALGQLINNGQNVAC